MKLWDYLILTASNALQARAYESQLQARRLRLCHRRCSTGSCPLSWRSPSQPGLIALGCNAAAEEASRHGVFCMGAGGTVSLYLQKPSIETQRAAGALDPCGRAPLHIGVMHMDAARAAALLSAFGVEPAGEGSLDFTPQARRHIPDEVWPGVEHPAERSLWNARVFPAARADLEESLNPIDLRLKLRLLS